MTAWSSDSCTRHLYCPTSSSLPAPPTSFFPWGSKRTEDLCKGAQDSSLMEKLWEKSAKLLRDCTGNPDAVKNLDMLAQGGQGKTPDVSQTQ